MVWQYLVLLYDVVPDPANLAPGKCHTAQRRSVWAILDTIRVRFNPLERLGVSGRGEVEVSVVLAVFPVHLTSSKSQINHVLSSRDGCRQNKPPDMTSSTHSQQSKELSPTRVAIRNERSALYRVRAMVSPSPSTN